ncbi:MAG: DUF4855 domain-containing protein [Syntrophomonadaceae bacterium]|nr:DUF4855 domain-containing protein [Syntrophomonadaceae bacterium]
MPKKTLRELTADIAPIEGRRWMERLSEGNYPRGVGWEVEAFSIIGRIPDPGKTKPLALCLEIKPAADRVQKSVNRLRENDLCWLEMEVGRADKSNLDIKELFLVGTRPLPDPKITCLSRHPVDQGCFIAGTEDGRLLTLDAHLPSNLKILEAEQFAGQFISLTPCGNSLLALLSSSPGRKIQVIRPETRQGPRKMNQLTSFSLSQPLIALAENDAYSFWGLTADGQVFLFNLPKQLLVKPTSSLGLSGSLTINVSRQLKPGGLRFNPLRLIKLLKKQNCTAFAFDGQRFWVHSQSGEKSGKTDLSVYRENGAFIRSFPNRHEVAVSGLSYRHNNLLVLDKTNQRLHLYLLADTMQPVTVLSVQQPAINRRNLASSLTPARQERSRAQGNHLDGAPSADQESVISMTKQHLARHPGFLEAGGPASGGIHDLCLLYVGGIGKQEVHRYDQDKLWPLVGYINTAGQLVDHFLDGFLILAQYSSLLNGRSFGLDLSGGAALKEDWVALFEEYFHSQANLWALEKTVAEINQRLKKPEHKVKVVLAIPTAQPQALDWDGQKYSLALPENRVKVTEWAIDELISRWHRAGFKHLVLAGFYYMTEQGAWDDPVLHAFPKLCRTRGYRSFAIPGITSSWITEFTRAGFDCVSLQSSHAFWLNPFTPPRYLLKCTGQIAREYGMGMEVELPYDVEKPGGQQKLIDYLEMAYIQGWAGVFKAYFQSYNLIKTLAESQIPEVRRLYDELYRLSRAAYRVNEANKKKNAADKFTAITVSSQNSSILYQGEFTAQKGDNLLRINVEGNSGPVRITDLYYDG